MTQDFKKSRTSSMEIPADVWGRYEENQNLLERAGIEFGLDATGMAYHAAQPDADDHRFATRIAGPASCAEWVAESAVKKLGLRAADTTDTEEGA